MTEGYGNSIREERILGAERSFADAMRQGVTFREELLEEAKRIARALYIMAFFVVAAGAVIMGVAGLRFVSDAEAGVMEVSVLHGALTNAIKANDTSGAIFVKAGPEGDALVMQRHVPSVGLVYETRIYLCQGFVVQEFALADRPYAPHDATRIVASSSFSACVNDGAVHVMTDSEHVTVALRSVLANPSGDMSEGAESVENGGTP